MRIMAVSPVNYNQANKKTNNEQSFGMKWPIILRGRTPRNKELDKVLTEKARLFNGMNDAVAKIKEGCEAFLQLNKEGAEVNGNHIWDIRDRLKQVGKVMDKTIDEKVESDEKRHMDELLEAAFGPNRES